MAASGRACASFCDVPITAPCHGWHGHRPQRVNHEGLWLAAAGAAANMLAINAAENDHDALVIVVGRRLPPIYVLRGAATMLQRRTTNPVADDVPVFNVTAPARRATLTPRPRLAPRPLIAPPQAVGDCPGQRPGLGLRPAHACRENLQRPGPPPV